MLIPPFVYGLRNAFGDPLVPGQDAFGKRGTDPNFAGRFEDIPDDWRRDDLLKPGICEVCEYEGLVQFGVCSQDCRDIDQHRWFGWRDSYQCATCGAHEDRRPAFAAYRWTCHGLEWRGFCSETHQRAGRIRCPEKRSHRTSQDCLKRRHEHGIRGVPGQGQTRPAVISEARRSLPGPLVVSGSGRLGHLALQVV